MKKDFTMSGKMLLPKAGTMQNNEDHNVCSNFETHSNVFARVCHIAKRFDDADDCHQAITEDHKGGSGFPSCKEAVHKTG